MFAVVSGCYSDVTFHGVTDDEKLANDYCAIRNGNYFFSGNVDPFSESSYKFRVMEIPKLDDTCKFKKDISIFHMYIVRIKNDDSSIGYDIDVQYEGVYSRASARELCNIRHIAYNNEDWFYIKFMIFKDHKLSEEELPELNKIIYDRISTIKYEVGGKLDCASVKEYYSLLKSELDYGEYDLTFF